MPSPKLEPLVLADDERQVLEEWARRRKTAQALALRSRIVLAFAAGAGVSAVAAELGVSRTTAGRWRSRFLKSRLKGLNDEPRPGRPRTVTDEHVEEVSPRRWSRARRAATPTGRPGRWPGRRACPSPRCPGSGGSSAPQAAHRAGQKSQIQALDRTAPILPMLPTTPARMTHDYVRNGTTGMFAVFDLASGATAIRSSCGS